MTSLTQKFATTMITLMISGTILFANTTSVYVHVLSDNEWKTIEESAEMEAMLEIEEIPTAITSGCTDLSIQDWDKIEREVEDEALLNQDGLLTNPILVAYNLTEADWTEIKEAAELDAMLDF